MEEYLTTAELSERIKMAPGTIRNLVWQNKLKKDVHYVKPTSRKLLFVWSKMKAWLHGDTPSIDNYRETTGRSLINI